MCLFDWFVWDFYLKIKALPKPVYKNGEMILGKK